MTGLTQPVSQTRMNLGRARVLAVEDNPQALEILSQILLGFGVSQARKCGSAADARSLIDIERLDLMLIDDELPPETGFELTRYVRSKPSGPNYTTPVIMVTGNPSAERVVRARDGGANFVVAKPLAPGVLLQRIEWIARDSRVFVSSDGYRGPDRRFRSVRLAQNQEERRAEALRLMAAPERALAQDEIDSLFG